MFVTFIKYRTWLIRYFFIYDGEVSILKEIGEKFKETRETMGISIDEVCEDLKVSKKYLNDIEEGNMDSFNDIFSLKSFIKDYAKYLGINKEDLIDEFNEYLFDYTSKISLDDIKQAKGEVEVKEEVIKSPYTQIPEKKSNIKIILLILGVIVLIAIAIIIVYFKTIATGDLISMEAL